MKYNHFFENNQFPYYIYTFNIYHAFILSNMERYIPRRMVLIPDIQNASFSETNEQGNQLACNYLIETCVFFIFISCIFLVEILL